MVVERNPTYYNLFGRVEYRATFGAMVTDFRNIRAGSLHRANGGFLVLDAMHVLQQPFVWDAMKRALSTGTVVIENLAEQLTLIPASSLHPQEIPLDVKVVLIGSPRLYGMMNAVDEDFPGLFKVQVDFAPEMGWSDENVQSYAAFVRRWWTAPVSGISRAAGLPASSSTARGSERISTVSRPVSLRSPTSRRRPPTGRSPGAMRWSDE